MCWFMSEKIGIYEFNLMLEMDRANYLWGNGTHLGERIEGVMTIQLHSLSNFYVQVFYDREKNCITELRPFKATRLLEPYLEQLDLKSLDL